MIISPDTLFFFLLDTIWEKKDICITESVMGWFSLHRRLYPGSHLYVTGGCRSGPVFFFSSCFGAGSFTAGIVQSFFLFLADRNRYYLLPRYLFDDGL